MSDREPLMTRREAAQTLRVSPDTVSRLIGAGELRAVRIGRNVLVSRSEIEELIERGGANTRVGLRQS